MLTKLNIYSVDSVLIRYILFDLCKLFFFTDFSLFFISPDFFFLFFFRISIIWYLVLLKFPAFVFCNLFLNMLALFLIAVIIFLNCLSLNKSTILLSKMFLCFCNLSTLRLSVLIILFDIFNDADFDIPFHYSFKLLLSQQQADLNF